MLAMHVTIIICILPGSKSLYIILYGIDEVSFPKLSQLKVVNFQNSKWSEINL